MLELSLILYMPLMSVKLLHLTAYTLALLANGTHSVIWRSSTRKPRSDSGSQIRERSLSADGMSGHIAQVDIRPEDSVSQVGPHSDVPRFVSPGERNP